MPKPEWYPYSQATYYRNLKKAKALGCDIMDIVVRKRGRTHSKYTGAALTTVAMSRADSDILTFLADYYGISKAAANHRAIMSHLRNEIPSGVMETILNTAKTCGQEREAAKAQEAGE